MIVRLDEVVAVLCFGGWDPSTVEVAASSAAVGLGSELPLKLHQAPDPGAVGAEVRLDRGGQLADGGQVDAEQLRAPLGAAAPLPRRGASRRWLLSPVLAQAAINVSAYLAGRALSRSAKDRGPSTA